ncbi:MAG: hypothetical protein ACI9LM_000052 [Alteromonadaceae bacterium]|jgi:hypothetical protein
MSKIKQLSEEDISNLEDQILDVDTVMLDPDYVEPAIEFITLIDEKIQAMMPSINDETSDEHIKRLQLCAYTLSKLAEKAQEQLDEVKEAILSIKKSKDATSAYKSNK